jgi:DNA-directed RNA polymerase specialized sigma24 family protein
VGFNAKKRNSQAATLAASLPVYAESAGQGMVMSDHATKTVHSTLDKLFHAESRRILVTLIRLLVDFDTAGDARQDAFAAAAKQWPEQGIPANPRAWLVSTGRFKAIDALRRRSRFDARLPFLAASLRPPKIPQSRLWKPFRTTSFA